MEGDDVTVEGHTVLTFIPAPRYAPAASEAGSGPPSPPSEPEEGPEDDPAGPAADSSRNSGQSRVISRQSRSRSPARSPLSIPWEGYREAGANFPIALKLKACGEQLAWHPLTSRFSLAEAINAIGIRGDFVEFKCSTSFCKNALEPPSPSAPSIFLAAQDGLEVQEVMPEPPAQRPGPDVVGVHQDNFAEEFPHNIVQCLVYTPCYVLDILSVPVSIPCSVEWALELFEQNRDESQAACFDRLLPATPQPDRRYVICVAEPSWASNGATILLNGILAHRGVFAIRVPPRLNKGSILRAAGFEPTEPWEVYVHGLLHPLLEDLWVDLRSGFTVAVVPRGAGAPPAWHIADMLQETTGWDSDADIPERREGPGFRFLVLNEGTPFVIRKEGNDELPLKDQIASALGCPTYQLTVKPTSPRIMDLMYAGSALHGVLVGTAALQTIPYPPARRPEHRSLLVMDCRAVHQCFRWLLCARSHVDVHEVADLFADWCPATHLVAIKGAEVRHGLIHFTHGQVVKIEFIPAESHPDDEVDIDGGEADSAASPSYSRRLLSLLASGLWLLFRDMFGNF